MTTPTQTTGKRKRSSGGHADSDETAPPTIVDRMVLHSGHIQAIMTGGVPRPLPQYVVQRAYAGRVMAERLHWTAVVPNHVVALLMAFHSRLGKDSALGLAL